MTVLGTAESECLKRFERFCAEQEYPSGSRLFRQETQARDVYFVTAGFVKLIRLETNGNEAFVGLRAAGSLLGAGPLTSDHFHLYDAFAVATCRLFRMQSEQFRDLLHRDVSFSAQVHELRSSIESAQVKHYAQLACWSSRMRLLGFFTDMLRTGQIVQRGDSTDLYLRLPLKIGELAQYLAVTPAHLSRLLTQLEREGLVIRRGGWIVISAASAARFPDSALQATSSLGGNTGDQAPSLAGADQRESQSAGVSE